MRHEEHYVDMVFGGSKKPKEEILIFGKTPSEIETALAFYALHHKAVGIGRFTNNTHCAGCDAFLSEDPPTIEPKYCPSCERRAQKEVVRCKACLWEHVALKPDVCPLCFERARTAFYAASASGLRSALRSIAEFEETDYDFHRPKIDQMLERAEFAMAKFSEPDVARAFTNCLALMDIFSQFISLCAAHVDQMPEMVRRDYQRFAGLVEALTADDRPKKEGE